jgi:outer membrane protein assembly factor BamB
MRAFVRAACVFLGVGAVHLPPTVLALPKDWPQWRGPNRDGIVQGVTLPRHWPKALKEEWKVAVGEGISSPVVVGNNVYLFTRHKDDEVLLCLDLASGKELWRSEGYPAPYKPHPAAASFGKYPRSTPTVTDGKVFALGVSGILSCLDARTGKLLWRKDFSRDSPSYGASNSPLVADGLCIVHVGGGKESALTAFDAATGEVRWRYRDGSSPPYGSPILADLAGERQVVTFTSWNMLGVSAATGKLLWRVDAPFDGQERCITPVLYKELLIYADYKVPLRAIRLEKGDKGITAKDVWNADGHRLYMSSPVLAGDWLLGFSDGGPGDIFCLDASNGKTLWNGPSRQGGYAAILNAGSVWLVLTNNGQLIVVRVNSTAYERIAEYRVSETATYAHPVLLGNRILIKDQTTLRSFRIEEGAGKP